MKRTFKWQYIFLVIIVISVFLRFYKLGAIPASLNHDETALGYNAYSLLKTGTDEHSKFFPLSLESFGDWKLIGYPLIDMVPIALFGLNEFAIRFPSALAGVIGTALIYFIILKLFKNRGMALVGMFFYAVSPWSIYFSRMAYEANLATTLFLGGFITLFIFIEQEKKKYWYVFLSSILFGSTLFTYHSYILFMPLFVLGLLFLHHRHLPRNKKTYLAMLIFLLFICLSFISLLQGSLKKTSSLSVTSDDNVLYNRVDKLRGDHAKESKYINRNIHNKYGGILYQVGENYIASFSPTFLFDKGGEKLLHNLGYFGNLYLFDAFLLAAAVAFLFWNREKNIKFLLIWVLLAPIPSSITKDAPSSVRLYILMPLFAILAAYAAWQIVFFLLKKQFAGRIGIFVLSALFLVNVIYFLEGYFYHIDTQRARYLHYGYKEAVLLTNKYPDYKVVVNKPENFPYISFLFYTKYDPRKFQKEAIYYPVNGEGFHFVKSFGRYEFVETIDYTKVQSHTIYIDDTRLEDKEHTIYLPDGEPILGYYVVGKKK